MGLKAQKAVHLFLIAKELVFPRNPSWSESLKIDFKSIVFETLSKEITS